MKFKVTFKDPDTLSDAISNAVRDEIKLIPGLSDAEQQAVYEVRREEVSDKVSKWFKWGECLSVEIDTDADTIKVVDID